MKNINIPTSVIEIFYVFNKFGYEAYLVGGSIRDNLLDIEPKDYDIATNASIDEIKNIFTNYKLVETDLKNGTITLILSDMNVEITTYRDKDKTLKGDLLYRDFTINTLAYSDEKGIIDYYNGINDINNKIIRINGKDDTRFMEDPLRILRAIRLSSVLDFHIDDNTRKYIFNNVHLLKNVSLERIRDEFSKILLSDRPSLYIRDYFDVFNVFIPELMPLKGFEQNNPYHIYDCLEHTFKVIDNTEPDIVMRLTALFHDSGKPASYTEDNNQVGHFYNHHEVSIDIAKKVLKRLKYSNNIINRVIHLIHYHDYPLTLTKKSIRKLLNYFGIDDIYNLLAFKRADMLGQNPEFLNRLDTIEEAKEIIDQIIENDECFSIKQLNISGNDLKLIGITDGKRIGVILKELLNLVIIGQLPNEYELLLEKALYLDKKKKMI